MDAKRALRAYETRLAPERQSLLNRYTLKDIAFKVVGVGSVGTFCAIGLYMCGDGTPLFLQIKEAGKSVLERLAPKFKGHQGQRVVEGQRVMQAASDIFLGWTEDVASRRHFYVRHLKIGVSVRLASSLRSERSQVTRACAGARWLAPTRAPRTRQCSRGIWASVASSTTRSLHLRWPMRCGTNATMSNS